MSLFFLFAVDPLLKARDYSHFVNDKGIRSEIGDFVVEILVEAFDH